MMIQIEEVKLKASKYIPIFLLISLLTLTTTIHPTNAIFIEYVGRTTKDSFVPYFILYDPPGDGSYSTFTESNTHSSKLTLTGKIGFEKASGSWIQSWTTSTTYQTPDDDRSHFVVAKELRITWDVWHYESMVSEWYVAKYVSHIALSGAYFISFDDLDSYDMFVEDQTGNQGTYDHHIVVSSGGTISEEYEYLWTYSQPTWVGFEFALYGVQFGGGLSTQSDDSVEVEVTYTYHDDDETLDFYCESDDNLWSGGDPWDVDGFVWFDE